MSSAFATTFASPVRPAFDAPGNVMAPPPTSPSRHSSRPSSTKSTRSSKQRTTPTVARVTSARAPPLPVPARSSSMIKSPAETAPPRALDPLFQLPFGAPLPNMYESSASLSPSEGDDSDSEGPTPTRRGMPSRRRREARNKEASTTPTTASSSGSSLRKSAKATFGRKVLASPSSKRPSSTKKASLPRAVGPQGLGVEIEGLGWEHTMRASQDARRYEDAAFQQTPISSATYTSDLGSGISAQGSSPEVPQLGHAPPPLHAHAPPPMPTPPSPSRSRSSRSRHTSIHSNGEVKASKGAPRFLSEQVDSHEYESTYPSVELHPEHIVFATPATTTSKASSRRSSIASNLRTPSLIHSPASVSQAYPETPALPPPSTYAHRDQQPYRSKSVSSIGSSRSHASSQAYSAGQPTPSATRYATSNAYFPPPPPKSLRRYASTHDDEEEHGATPIPQVFPSTRPRQSSASRTASGPFPGPPTTSPHTRSQRSPAPSSTSVFPSTPHSSAPSSPAARRKSEIFPSVRQPPSSTARTARPVSSAPREEDGEDELDWMVSAQRKLDPNSRSPRSVRSAGGVRQVFASRRVEQPRSLDEQKAYEREEGGLGHGFESVTDFESVRAVDVASVFAQGEEEVEAELLDDATPVKSPSRRTVSEDEPPRTQHQHHAKRYSQSSATSGASEYASAAEHDGEDEGAEEASLSDAPSPAAPEVAVFSAPSTSTAPSSAINPDQTGLWVLDNITNMVANGNARRMSAIGEVSENETPSSRESAQASGTEEERQVFDAGRLNTKKLCLTPAGFLEPTTDGKSGESTPLAATPTRAEPRSSPLLPLQDPQVSTYPSALSPASLRSPYSPITTTPARPTFQRSSSGNSRASLYNHSNDSSLSTQTRVSGHSSHRSMPASNRAKGSKFSKKFGAFFGGGSAGERGVPPQPQGISSEQVRAWAAGGGEEEEERTEVLQDDMMMERKAASTSTGGTDEVVLLSEASGKREEVVHFESLLEKFQREERERLVELKASKWAAAQAAGSVEAQGPRVEPVM